jgi:signal peptidase II
VAPAGRRSAAVLLGTAAVAYVVDRLTKVWAEGSLRGRPPITVIPRVLDLRFAANPGGAFSIGQRAPWLFAAASIAVSVAIVATAGRARRPAVAVALGLVLGGALGNLTDRVLRGSGLDGRVVDFLDLHVWPVFNLADSAIVVGAALLALTALTERGAGSADEARGDRGP